MNAEVLYMLLKRCADRQLKFVDVGAAAGALVLVAVYFGLPVYLVEKEESYVAQWEDTMRTVLPHGHPQLRTLTHMISANPIDISNPDDNWKLLHAGFGMRGPSRASLTS